MMWTNHRMRYDRVTMKGKIDTSTSRLRHIMLSVPGRSRKLWSWCGSLNGARGLWTFRYKRRTYNYSVYRSQLLTKLGVPIGEARQLLERFMDAL